MKKAKRNNIALGHAFMMVGRNIKSYMLLSVTIILSFSLLLGFFVWTDSRIYNKYKDILSASPYVATLMGTYAGGSDLGEDVTEERYQLLIDKMKDMPDTYYYKYYESGAQITQYGDKSDAVTASIIYLPNDYFGYYTNYADKDSFCLKRYKVISGESNFASDDEVIIDQGLYNMLRDEQRRTAVTVSIPIETADGGMEVKTFKVIGVIEKNRQTGYSTDQDNKIIYHAVVFMPQSIMKDKDLASEKMLIYSKNNMPEIISLFRKLNIVGNANIEELQIARAEIRTQVFLKSLAALALFVLLGINLYSCFKNALNERRFEIGVKRAIGAPRKAVVGQFFREGMIVMVSNIAFSVYLIFNLAVIYKAVQKVFFQTIWTIDLSPYSAAIFLFSAFFLSVSFSLLFAYQSTNVEIAGQLKAE